MSLVLFIILFGSAARADVLRALTHGTTAGPRFSAALASSLALPSQQVSQEASSLRIILAAAERRQRASAVARSRWSSTRPAGSLPGDVSGPATTAPTHSWKADWYAIAACESGGRWALNTGNGFYGGLQFTLRTWRAYGGGPFDDSGPFPYSAGEQIAVAERVLAGQGPGAWPNCFRWT